MDSKLIFVIGARRTGTNLLRAILGSHSNIDVTPTDEELFLQHDKFRTDYDFSKKTERIRLYKEFLSSSHLTRKNWGWGLDLRKLKDDTLNSCNSADDALNILLDNYFRNSGNKKRAHLHHEFGNVEQIIKSFPDAKYIFLQRDPRATVASIKKYAMNRRKKVNLKDVMMDEINQWIRCHDGYNKLIDLGGNILKVDYEQLVMNPESNLRRLFEFIGEPYESGVMQFDKNWNIDGLSYYSNSSYKARQEGFGKYWKMYDKNDLIYKSTIYKWKEILTNEDIDMIKSNIGNRYKLGEDE